MNDDTMQPDDFETPEDFQRYAARLARIAERTRKAQARREAADQRALLRMAGMGISDRLRALEVGASELFTQYRTSVQLSASVHRIAMDSGHKFTSKQTPEGVRITRLS